MGFELKGKSREDMPVMETAWTCGKQEWRWHGCGKMRTMAEEEGPCQRAEMNNL